MTYTLILYLNRCVARMCCKSVRHWLTAAPQQLHTDNRWVWHIGHRDIQLLCFRCTQSACDNCRHRYRLHYPRRPAQYIISVKPERSEATWRLVNFWQMTSTYCGSLWRRLHGAIPTASEWKLNIIGNKSVPIQLAQCWFRGLAISNAKIQTHISNKIYGSNFIKQHSETVTVWNYQNAGCSFKNNFIVLIVITFGTFSFLAGGATTSEAGWLHQLFTLYCDIEYAQTNTSCTLTQSDLLLRPVRTNARRSLSYR